ncbi:MAG: zinc-dependent alcohol dehydrogenase family protein [Thermodesulfobacteriota bacterium]
MRAMLLERTGPVEDKPLRERSLSIPEPQGDEVRLRVLACGVCHTDLHTVEGEVVPPRLPLVPGHQVVGIVDECGPQAGRHARGDRVGVTWFHSGCGSCSFCREGRENLCKEARFTGLDRDGGYAEFMVIPEASAFPIPREFSDVDATPLLCGGVIGYRALRFSDARPGKSLGLYGFGNSAHVVIQIAVKRGIRVHVFTRSRGHQELARELGAVWVGTARDQPPEPMDSAIVFAPAGPLVPEVLRHLNRGGTVALAGIYMTPIPEMDYRLIYGERTVRSVANTTRQDAEELLQVAAQVPVRTVVESFPLAEANRVLGMMKRSELRGGAALVV